MDQLPSKETAASLRQLTLALLDYAKGSIADRFSAHPLDQESEKTQTANSSSDLVEQYKAPEREDKGSRQGTIALPNVELPHAAWLLGGNSELATRIVAEVRPVWEPLVLILETEAIAYYRGDIDIIPVYMVVRYNGTLLHPISKNNVSSEWKPCSRIKLMDDFLKQFNHFHNWSFQVL